MSIAFFISDHGYGHIMRNLPVIKEILNMGHEVLLVAGKKHISLAKQYLQKECNISKLKCVEMHTDGGIIVKPGTLILDKDKTKVMVTEYVKEFPERIDKAKKLFEQYKIEKVVADIVPWALTAAKEAGIKSYIMASFTWMEQYEGYIDGELLNVFEEAFNSADIALMYELVNEPTKKRFKNKVDVGFVARQFHEEEVKKIKKLFKRPIVYISVGGSNSGLNFDIDVSNVPYDFICTEGLKLKGENVYFLPVEIENTQDYIKAADYCISKAGWGSVAELILAGAKTALIERPDVPEDTMLINELKNRNECISIDVNEIRNIDKVIRKLENSSISIPTYENGYMKIVMNICTETM